MPAKDRPTRPASSTARLTFQDWRDLPHVSDPLHQDISAIAACGRTLFTACDETASIEVLTRGEDGQWGDHRHVSVADFFDLPDGPDGEMDIEGLSATDGYLWITGSHSLKRDKAEREDHSAAEALERMLDIDRDANRYFLGRIPLIEEPGGIAWLRAKDGKRRAGCIPLKKNKSHLLKWLKKDPHLSDFLSIPSKENGFDIEGLAARGSRAWLGLRGPVLRGHGVILEMDFKTPKKRTLKPRKIDGDQRYRKHLLDTEGLGIRDLCLHGTDLLVLVGTPLASDGPARVLRWKDAVYDTTSGVVDPARIELALELPYKADRDHPEGIDLVETGGEGGERLMVVYDSPAPSRTGSNPAWLKADTFALA